MKGIKIPLLVAVALLSSAARLYADITIPAQTAIVVTLDQSVSSTNAKVGEKIAGTVALNLVVNGQTAIPKGSKAVLKVASVQPSGRLKTPAKLWLRLTSVEVNGKTYTVSTNLSGQTGPSHNKRNVIAIGGGSALGAAIGAIAGGGKGAAIGAAAGAGAGTAGAAATGKKDITYPPETKLRFTTKTPVTLQ